MKNSKLKHSLKRFGLPLGILLSGVVIVNLIMANPPQSKRFAKPPATTMTVEVLPIVGQNYQVKLQSFGVVKPRTQSVLVSQASGQIKWVNPNFRDGGFFEQGDVLLRVDDRDHRAEVKVARANLLDAKQKFTEEQARGEQAKVDWQRLGKGTASDLVLRKPQLAAAKAKVLSAEAQLDKALLALERTEIKAPYAGRVLSKKVDLGQVVSNNAQLADIYAVDYVEVRLPINNQDLALVALPEEYRFKERTKQNQILSDVWFQSDISAEHQWQGKVVRTEGAIDENSQQLYVVAQIDDPYANDRQQAIKIGQYVNAQISGVQLNNAIVIPNQSIYQGSYVYIVEGDVLLRKEVTLLWKNQTDAVVKSGLRVGQQLVTTPLGQVNSGTGVQIRGQGADQSPKGAAGKNAPFIEQILQRMPEGRRKTLEQRAEQQGTTVEDLIKKRMQQRKQSAPAERQGA